MDFYPGGAGRCLPGARGGNYRERRCGPVRGADWLADLESSGYAVVPHGVDLDKSRPNGQECDRMIVSPPSEIATTAKSAENPSPSTRTSTSPLGRDLPLSVMEELLVANQQQGAY